MALTTPGIERHRGWAAQSPTRRHEERALFDRLARERSREARDALVERFMPLARQLARRYRNSEDVEDLEQVAAIGLVNAINRFDAGRGLAFSSFAVPTILGELKRHLRDRGWSVRAPRDVQELAARLHTISDAMVGELGRAPTVAELAERADRTTEQVLEAMQAATARRAVSLDEPRHDADEPHSRRHDVAVEDPGFALVENADALDRLMTTLSEREREILRLRFREDRVQSQIAQTCGVSQMHVSRLIRSALARLQTAADSAARSADGF